MPSVAAASALLMRGFSFRWSNIRPLDVIPVLIRTMTNIVSGRQLRAARVLAGLSQAELATESGFNPRAAKYWERRENELPTSVPDTLAAIERTLRRHGVEVFAWPTPGARLTEITSSGHN